MAENRLSSNQRRIILIAGLGILALLFWVAPNVLLVFFSAVLLAIFLRACAKFVSRVVGISAGWSLLTVVLGFLILFALGGWALGDQAAQQAQRLSAELPRAVDQTEKWFRAQPLLQNIIPSPKQISSRIPAALNKASGVLSSTFGVLANAVVIVVVGIYLAGNPSSYAAGFVRLVPPANRERAREVLQTIGRVLERWLVGRVILMVSNAVVTAIGLLLLGVPLAVSLGILAGLLNFVPNLGPIIAAVPAVLLAFLEGPSTALYVALLYLGYQMIDGYVLTPLVQGQTVSLPPALIIMAQVLMGVTLGVMGVLLAVPLLAVILVLTRLLYLQDTLGEEVKVPGSS